MDSQRTLLWIALVFVGLLMYQAWQHDYGTSAQTAQAPAAPASEAKPEDVPQLLTAPAGEKAPAAGAPAAPTAPENTAEVLQSGQRIHVVTDVLDVQIDTLGGDMRQVKLPTYPVSIEQRDVPLTLLTDKPDDLFVAQSGLLSQEPAPDHHAQYTADQKEYKLQPGSDELKVTLHWNDPTAGVSVDKVYTFHRDSFAVDLAYVINNHGTAPWEGRQYRQFQRLRSEPKTRFIRTFTGGAIYSQENKYQKLTFDEMANENLSRDVKGGWAAMVQHYFAAAWVPDQNAVNHFYSKALDGDRFVLGMVSPTITVAPGKSGTLSTRAYIGPKIQDRLEKMAPGLELTIDYGILTFIAKPIFWLLTYIHGLVHNWGWSIMLLTLTIKLAFYKLSEASYKSMANMRRLQPKIVALRERYGDDRQRMSAAMMEMYKKEKVNPLGGCLPIMIQIPVFISLYWVLIESVELREAPFILWIHDLTLKDPYYVLPLLMGISMFIQQKLNPPPPDPLQAKILSFLPVVLTAFFALFPSGLVLYWVTNNVLSIAQQAYIYRKFGKPTPMHMPAKKPVEKVEKAENAEK
jgi:YidC/Oxa1 family membrane protein insertase